MCFCDKSNWKHVLKRSDEFLVIIINLGYNIHCLITPSISCFLLLWSPKSKSCYSYHYYYLLTHLFIQCQTIYTLNRLVLPLLGDEGCSGLWDLWFVSVTLLRLWTLLGAMAPHPWWEPSLECVLTVTYLMF